jgi:hypothetical protein
LLIPMKRIHIQYLIMQPLSFSNLFIQLWFTFDLKITNIIQILHSTNSLLQRHSIQFFHLVSVSIQVCLRIWFVNNLKSWWVVRSWLRSLLLMPI